MDKRLKLKVTSRLEKKKVISKWKKTDLSESSRSKFLSPWKAPKISMDDFVTPAQHAENSADESSTEI